MEQGSKDRVILFCPVRQDHETLELVLRSHRGLRGVEEYWYYDDNDDEDSSVLLQTSKCRILPKLRYLQPQEYKTGGNTHEWNGELVTRVAMIRNAAIYAFLESGASHLFIVDSDLVLTPGVVKTLLSLGEEIVSEVFWSQWNPGELWMPNVWDTHPTTYQSSDSITRLRDSSVYRVGGLGACTLIKRSALDGTDVWYSPVPGLENIWGEDRWFCIRAASHGLELWADASETPFHVYRKSQLEEAQVWYDSGADPDYFREMWLTDEWVKDVEQAVSASVPQAEKKVKRIAFCMPGETFSGWWMINMIDTLVTACKQAVVQPIMCYSSDPAVTRQVIAKQVLSDPLGFDLVLWIDDDNILTAEHLKMMIDDLDRYPTIDAVVGWCVIVDAYGLGKLRQASAGVFENNHIKHFGEAELMKADGLVECDWSGFPAVLMRYDLLKSVGAKAFRTIPDPASEFGAMGEDVSFWYRAKEQGARLVVDPRVKVPHLKLRDANEFPAPIMPVAPVAVNGMVDPASPDISTKERE